MTIGKPFNKPTDAQRAAFNARAKKDLGDFLGAFLEPAARAAGKYLDENPGNTVAAVLSDPFMKASLVTIRDRVRDLRAEQAAEADAAEAAAQAEVHVHVEPPPKK